MTRRFFCKVLLVAVAIFGLMVLSGVLLAQGRSEEAFERVREVQERNTDRLMAKEGVEGTAIGYNQNDRLAIKVFTAGPGVAGIPQELDGVPVQVVVTGKFYALEPGKGKGGPPEGKGPGDKGGKKVNPKKHLDRPVPIGVSTGNEGECSAGTIGCRVIDSGGAVYALSNNHVYALENTAPIDSRVLQPGTYDAKPPCAVKSGDVIGTLSDFEPIVFSTEANNTIDAAIATVTFDDFDGDGTNELAVGNATPDDGYGIPMSSPVAAELDQLVKKYGRTTRLTSGVITGISVTVNVIYSSGTARFVDQITIGGGSFSADGDSGSLIVTQDGNNPVGLLFAGSSIMTVANPIDAVLSRFGVTVDDTPPPQE